MTTSDTFHEVAFPLRLAFGSTGGPERRTEIVTLASGYEERNTRWADSRRRWDAGSAVRTFDDIQTLVAFFEERRGRLHGFRFRDPFDHKSSAPSADPTPTDQTLGSGDGTTATFQLVKLYGAGATAWTRQIAKPVAGSVRVAIDGTEQTVGTDVTVDTATGLLTFTPTPPAAGTTITAGFEFDVPVRFDSDRLEISLAAFEAGDLPSVPIVEIRL